MRFAASLFTLRAAASVVIKRESSWIFLRIAVAQRSAPVVRTLRVRYRGIRWLLTLESCREGRWEQYSPLPKTRMVQGWNLWRKKTAVISRSLQGIHSARLHDAHGYAPTRFEAKSRGICECRWHSPREKSGNKNSDSQPAKNRHIVANLKVYVRCKPHPPSTAYPHECACEK